MTDGAEVKTCKSSCDEKTYHVTTSAALFPVPGTYSMSTMFCEVVENIDIACLDQTRDIIEVFYPNICKLVETVLINDACKPNYRPTMIKEWGNDTDEEFANLILRYTQDNIVLVDIYMKDPFAVKFLIDEYAPKYIEYIEY